ncbi:alpha/beta fold hydrolase [Plantactinospora endophytica]|uniref:alpha/beta fold hydrolase n=1 Tax=Plantactinospora endophytica TaxID=673535 RepID=UPI0023B265C4
MPGDADPSVPRALMTPPAACAAWLDEVLAQLTDHPAHLVGFSYGGWIAMNQATRASERVASITLLDPAGLTKPTPASGGGSRSAAWRPWPRCRCAAA